MSLIKHTKQSFVKLTNRDKCLYMWRWLKEHPLSGKVDFFFELGFTSKEILDDAGCNLCYACIECGEVCYKCPILWIPESRPDYGNSQCIAIGTAYDQWTDFDEMDVYEIDPKEVQEAIQDIIDLVINTWKV